MGSGGVHLVSKAFPNKEYQQQPDPSGRGGAAEGLWCTDDNTLPALYVIPSLCVRSHTRGLQGARETARFTLSPVASWLGAGWGANVGPRMYGGSGDRRPVLSDITQLPGWFAT